MKPADLMRSTALALALACACGAAQAGATITIINANNPGVGFNDPTPVAPIGGNPGTTLGQQRLNAFTHAANIWGATINSPIEIRIRAAFVPMFCTANSAVLGAAGTADIFAEFANSPRPESWYPSALASKIAGEDLPGAGSPHIVANFNSRLGLFADCLPGSPYYLGLDANHGTSVDLVAVLLHEMAHGLGFQTFTNGQSGNRIEGRPSVWDHYLTDSRTGKNWAAMDNAERQSSAVSGNALVWSGTYVNAAASTVLAPMPNLAISGSAAGDASGNYLVGEATFGPPLSSSGVTGQLMPVVDQGNGTGLACAPLSAANARAVKGNVALVDRGTCTFVIKAKHVQDAGGIGMVVADNAPGDVLALGGTDPSITIPAVRVSQADGVRLKARLASRSRTQSGVVASLGVDPGRLAGMGSNGMVMMYSPVEYQPGSSVSHFSTDGRPNLLMEPSINGDLSHQLSAPRDLTLELMKDIGW
ncbi:PA domain-containing protein [Pseudoduganella sp. GCM10020061]|uniref:PA domain-containing protein n=1 Tax=Pseudoduganella sp. GCM10020061 TaxID=3317345 RepID=UPI00363A4F61